MLRIQDYTVLAEIGEGPRSKVYVGYHNDMPHRKLCIKTFKAFQITSSERKYYLQKIEHLKILNNPNFLVPLTFKSTDDSWFMTREYFEGVTLDVFLKTFKKIDLEKFFKIATSLCDMIDIIHQAGIIHGSIKPHNILINPVTLELKIVDFISPLDVRNISHFIYDQDFVKSTLAYTSPEETGRINYRVDFTTDIYSLGVVFYELLSGALPYESEDPLEMIHYHMAKVPISLNDLNTMIPPIISNIINKMMSKRPEQRYQTASGVNLDFEKFQKKLISGIKPGEVQFSLGEKDHHSRIKFISKMVGRDFEATKILECYDQVAIGNFRSMFISGFSGIGKTRLIQELQKPIVNRRGYFTSGKFDVYQKNIPYSSLVQAFRNLVRTFLTESDVRVVRWKEKILEAVGEQGQVLIDVIPELEILIGTQPQLEVLPPVEARNRFNRVFESFLQSIASKENPLVLFIDDLQWCDLASFEFLTNVFNNSQENAYLFFIGAYRHNEVDSDHPLIQLLNKIKKENYPMVEIHLGPISEEACNEMISYILNTPPVQTTKLASFLSHLTDGNPLFISESLSYLFTEKLISFDEKKKEWIWDFEDLNQTTMPTTIVELFSSKLKKLNPAVINLLDYCACMGNTFEPDDLSHIAEIGLLNMFELLRPALGQSLIIENKNQLQFVHDKVQEATLAGISMDRREMIHWKIGNYMAAESKGDYSKVSIETIFSMASHFNIASEITVKLKKVVSDEMNLQICEVNFQAGNSALESLATFAANDYFNRALKLLPNNSWENYYHLTYQLHLKLAKTELMVGRYSTSEKLLADLLNNANSDLDKIEALAEQTTSLSSIGNFINAIETANKGLAYFDMDIPSDASLARKKCELIMNEIHGKNEDIWSRILSMPFSNDRRSKVELSFYSELIPDLYMSGMPDQLYLSAAQSTQNSLAGGMNESVIYAFSIMGLNLGEKEQFEQAFKYEDLARNMVEKYPNTFGSTRGINGVVWCNMHSRSTPDQIIAYCLKGIQSGKNCGDLYNAGLCYGPLMWNMQVKGDDFKKAESTVNECLQFSKKFDLNFSIGLSESVLAGWIAPMMRSDLNLEMGDKIKKWKKENHIASIGSYFMHLGLSNYYLQNYEKAKENFLEVEKHLSGMTDNVLKRQWFIFKLLTDIEIVLINPKLKNSEQVMSQLEKSMKFVLSKVETWVSLGPLLSPFYAFLKAKISELKDGMSKSIGYYLEAIHYSHVNQYIFFEGFINEVLGRELRKENLSYAKKFLEEAWQLYLQCGVDSKIRVFKKDFSEIVEEFYSEKNDSVNNESLTKERILNNNGLNFDLEYFLKSSAAIATEIDVEVLVKKIVDIVIESSGAQLGLITVLKDNELKVLAKKDLKETTKLQDEMKKNYPLESDTDISQAIIRYVYRSEQNVILENAMLEGEFVNDKDVERLQLKSILCVPLLSQSKIIGIVYLENRLMPGVFQSKHIKLIQLLSTQAAIALEHALLLDSMLIAKNKIKDSLAEKEILLKEINHRVKNNLQIIWSLFNLQSRKVKDKETIDIFKEAQNRIYSISLIHEKLFQSNLYGKIQFKDYLNGLIANLLRSFGGKGRGEGEVKLILEVSDLSIPLDIAVPLGIIVNEVVTNIFKYAFSMEQKNKEIRIFLEEVSKKPSTIQLKIEDNGRGLPIDFDHENIKGIGMTLIRNLSSQIQASYQCLSENGVKYSFNIPIDSLS